MDAQQNLNFTGWTEMNLELILMSENDIAEFKKYVKSGVQGKDIGKSIWYAVEKLYPDTKVWETCTPYFEKRNIHFYVNICGFHITEFFNEKHPMLDTPDDFIGDGNEGMFVFQKEM